MKTFTKAIAGLAFALAGVGAANAADLYQPAPAAAPVYTPSAFSFEGFYLGVYGGAANYGPSALLGGVVGGNVELAPGFIGGLEAQAGMVKGGGTLTGEAFALGKLGALLSDEAMIYGTAGIGLVGPTPVYALGGGVEVAVVDNVSLRGELLGIGAWGAPVSVVRGTAGVLWHF